MTTRFPELDKLKLAVALPSYNGAALNRVPLIYMFRQVPQAFPIATQASLLACCFNITLANAIKARNEGNATHFLMVHDDICPTEQEWFEHLWAAYKDSNAQMICAVSPIKDERGLTSIAVDVEEAPSRVDAAKELLAAFAAEHYELMENSANAPEHEELEKKVIDAMVGGTFGPRLAKPKRLTLREIYMLARTFTMPGLLLNTGMLLFDLREPWVDKIHFHIDDSMEWINGVPAPRSASEDWNFTRDARRLGCERIFATTAVKIEHVGQARFPNHLNDGPWGTLVHDDGT